MDNRVRDFGGHRAGQVLQQKPGDVVEDLSNGLDHASHIKLHWEQCLWALPRWEQGELLWTDTQICMHWPKEDQKL